MAFVFSRLASFHSQDLRSTKQAILVARKLDQLGLLVMPTLLGIWWSKCLTRVRYMGRQASMHWSSSPIWSTYAYSTSMFRITRLLHGPALVSFQERI